MSEEITPGIQAIIKAAARDAVRAVLNKRKAIMREGQMVNRYGDIDWQAVSKADECMLRPSPTDRRHTKHLPLIRAALMLPHNMQWYKLTLPGLQRSGPRIRKLGNVLTAWLRKLEYPAEVVNVRCDTRNIYVRWAVRPEKQVRKVLELEPAPEVELQEQEIIEVMRLEERR